MEEGSMLRRVVLKLIHTLATAVFTIMEVAGIPRVKEEEKGGRDG